ncbi:ECF transporter S component [Bacillus thermotolerans]|uniref:B12-regulated ECF transporter for dimethylbenzimidazole n=1 Tax=Bacillus thermotolerans TaxID=1221996 RepID=A0A0F5I3A8_BACTR|nr:ECF transporter S component [Bacillus thermotolerans]KKB36022.1 putative B12-regulated ECF transporter for dimethylbenzimidazole [Bacillus thermotolerans]KKB40149.1 putative B12-regulated ECF transporter for dimethylbenzimidazole [Bacillus thermotolerans]
MKARHISWLALFTALSVVGGMLKVPAPVSSVALDSFPALLAAGLLGAVPGALVGAFGHLISALMGGMPLGPLHALIAAEMAAIMWLFGWLYARGKRFFSLTVFVLLNGLVSPAPFILLMGWPFYVGMVLSLMIASLVNGVIGALLLPRLLPVYERLIGRVRA